MEEYKDRYCKITAEVHDSEFRDMDKRITWEIPSDDINGEDMIDMLHTIMIGLTFTESTFKQTLVDYVIENKLVEEIYPSNGFNKRLVDDKFNINDVIKGID